MLLLLLLLFVVGVVVGIVGQNHQFYCFLLHQQCPLLQPLLPLIVVIAGATENAVVPNYACSCYKLL